MKPGFFITGTDTGVGKTWFTVLLMRYLQQQGHIVNGMKPIASGAEQYAEGLRNEDALIIQENCSGNPDYELVNPFTYAPPIAPHVAAQQAGVPIDIDTIVQAYRQLAGESDLLIVEGVGGWRVPINNHVSLAHLVRQLDLPIILVVGLRLGCINHALLTAEVIRQDGLSLYGWAVSEIEKDYLFKDETLLTLENALGFPPLGEIPYAETGQICDAVLNIASADRVRLPL